MVETVGLVRALMLACNAIEFKWIGIREGGPRSVDCSKTVVVGEVAEWLMAPVLKTGIPERVSGVRIPPSPPDFLLSSIQQRELRSIRAGRDPRGHCPRALPHKRFYEKVI